MARFDEEANINWAERLQQVGAQVVYGVFGLKTHAKLALLLRREKDPNGQAHLQRYAHLGTGNYHPRTARMYTDFGLLTANPEICADVDEVFLHITSLAKANRLKRLWLAPFTMHRHLLEAIRRETRHAKEGRPARIVAKMNALLEEAVIKALYAASQAGVKIDLIVRGACALRPGVKDVSDNIRVRSIVGRFLEHSRIWLFDNDGAEDVYLSSADWMGRNLFRRIEVAFPVLDPALKARVIDEGLKPYLADSHDAWELGADGSYTQGEGQGPRTPRVGAARTCCSGWRTRPRPAFETASGRDGSDPLAPRRSRSGRTRSRASPDGERHQAGRAGGRLARRPFARYDAGAGQPRRPRPADRARAEAQVSGRARARPGRGADRGARRRGLAGQPRAGARGRPPTDSGRGRRVAARRRPAGVEHAQGSGVVADQSRPRRHRRDVLKVAIGPDFV